MVVEKVSEESIKMGSVFMCFNDDIKQPIVVCAMSLFE